MSKFSSSCSVVSLILIAFCALADDSKQASLRLETAAGDRLKVVQLIPPLEEELGEKEFHKLKDGQRMLVQFQYTVESVDGARIFVLPYFDGKPLRKYQAQGSSIYPKGSGKASRYFRLTDESMVDEIQVQMRSGREQLLVLKIPVRIKGAKPLANPVDPFTTPTFLAIEEFQKEQNRRALNLDFAAALAHVEKALKAPDPENVHPESWKAYLETARVQILCFIEAEKAADLAVKYQPSHLQLLQNNLSETEVLVPVLQSQARMISSLIRDQPDIALVLVEHLENALEDTSEANGEHVFSQLRWIERQLESCRRSIEQAKQKSD